MIGLFSLLAESAVPGSNPQLKFLQLEIPPYDGPLMAFDASLVSPFVKYAIDTLFVCAFLQQLAVRRGK